MQQAKDGSRSCLAHTQPIAKSGRSCDNIYRRDTLIAARGLLGLPAGGYAADLSQLGNHHDQKFKPQPLGLKEKCALSHSRVDST